MDDSTIISASDLFAEDPTEMLRDVGVPNYNRRLTDKVLAAFNHAYSMGEYDLADRLREVLSLAEERGQERYPQRKPNQAESQAELWVQFVDARDSYRRLTEEAPEAPPPEAVDNALEEMRDAYKRWTEQAPEEAPQPRAGALDELRNRFRRTGGGSDSVPV